MLPQAPSGRRPLGHHLGGQRITLSKSPLQLDHTLTRSPELLVSAGPEVTWEARGITSHDITYLGLLSLVPRAAHALFPRRHRHRRQLAQGSGGRRSLARHHWRVRARGPDELAAAGGLALAFGLRLGAPWPEARVIAGWKAPLEPIA